MGIIAAFAVPHPPLLVPGVGGDNRLQAKKTEDAYWEAASRSAVLDPETLLIFSPHAPMYQDYFHISPGRGAHGDFGSFGASEASFSVEYDQEFIAAMEALLAQRGIPGGTAAGRGSTLDHGVMVPLHFFGEAVGDKGGAGKGVKIVRVGLSGLSRELHREFGKAAAWVAETLGRRTVVIASGDLSHRLLESGPYGYAPEGPEFDEQLCAALAQGDVTDMMAINEQLSEAAAECGLRSFIMMGGALEGLVYEPELLSYEGPFGVGYAVACYEVDTRYALQEASLPVALARQSLQSYFDGGSRRPTIETPEVQGLLDQRRKNPKSRKVYEELNRTRAGVFVSLHRNGELRGCIGTIAPTKKNALAEIVHNAVSAAVEDSRFPPMERGELDSASIKVDVLGKPEPVTDRSALDAERFGVIVSLGYRRGLLLPALEGVDTPEEQIAIALSKAGIRSDEPYELERFEVVRYT